MTLASLSLLVVLTSILLRNPFGEVCFDADFAATTGWPVDRIDLLMMGLVAVVCVVGIPAVGLMLGGGSFDCAVCCRKIVVNPTC